MEPISRNLVDKCLELGKVILAFGRVERVTHHEDGIYPETDTDHTVMLGIMACAFAKEFVPRLDLGKIAQFALVHDLVEAYAGDTPTYGMKEGDDKQAKDAREAAALTRLKEEFADTFPWITETIDEYESLKSEEARYVKVFDKVLPKIVHTLNNGASVRTLGGTKESTIEHHAYQLQNITDSYGCDQPEAVALLEALMQESHEKVQY